ncbi:hypothetical protein H6B11_14460 [Mediterraneibacter glycyrrhizinilyticus]|nr:hypothetical protein [Mediterraneibacter glycyrrhizinilyticus]MBM6855338.1 hypothetical protein [Mediterraneibacter glycyrrhizinilyticus]
MYLNTGFDELNGNEMQEVDGGFIVALVAIGGSTYAITSGMVAGAVGTAWGLGTVGYQIYNAFR